MYHYIRPLKRSRYPRIKGLNLEHFVNQLEYIRKHYNVITINELIGAVTAQAVHLPPKAILLTFDDGFIDHYNYVFPLLDKYKIQGTFFPSTMPILQHCVYWAQYAVQGRWDQKEVVFVKRLLQVGLPQYGLPKEMLAVMDLVIYGWIAYPLKNKK